MLSELEEHRRLQESWAVVEALRRLLDRGTRADDAAADGFAAFIETMPPRVEARAGWSWKAARALHRATGRLCRDLETWRPRP